MKRKWLDEKIKQMIREEIEKLENEQKSKNLCTDPSHRWHGLDRNHNCLVCGKPRK